jgi:hypothetical protein
MLFGKQGAKKTQDSNQGKGANARKSIALALALKSDQKAQGNGNPKSLNELFHRRILKTPSCLAILLAPGSADFSRRYQENDLLTPMALS